MPSVFEPRSVAEAAQAIAEAAREGRRLAIDGGGEADVVLRTSGLDRLLEHEAGDLTATAEGGIRLSELNRRLAAAGQMLALDPPGDPTLGACLAANLSGPLRHRYGTMRDLVIGVTVVLADGTVANAGGKVVKNVAGYDLGKLLCGSRGRLGLIARLSVRLHPLPPARRSVVAPAAEASEAAARWQALARSRLVPAAVDLLWPGHLALLVTGAEPVAEAHAHAAAALLGGSVADDGEAVWRDARELQARLPGRLPFSPGRLHEELAALRTALVRPGPGLAHVEEDAERPEPDAVRALRERVRHELDPRELWAA